jgi:hypothetical protein
VQVLGQIGWDSTLEFGRASEHDSDQTITALGWKHGPQAFVAKRRQGAIFSIKGLSKPIRLSEK